MRIVKNKITLFILSLLLVFLPFISGTFAQSTLTMQDCQNTSHPEYGSQECIKVLLGTNEINPPYWRPVDITSWISYGFQFLLGIVVLLVVFRIVMAGIGIANAKEDADKRKEGFKKLLNAVIGLIVAFSALAITRIVTDAMGINVNERFLRTCIEVLRDVGPNSPVYERCRRIEARHPQRFAEPDPCKRAPKPGETVAC